MELDPEIIKIFESLQVSRRPISKEELDNFDPNAPLQSPRKVDHPSYKTIPKFFHSPPPANDPVRQMLRKEAYSLFLQQESQMLLDNKEINMLWTILEEHVSETTPKKEQLVGYYDYRKVMSKISPKCRKYVNMRLFGKLMMRSEFPGKVQIICIFNYIVRKVSVMQNRISLSYYDEMGHGYLREIDLENYVIDLIPTLGQIRNCLEASFQDFYVCTVVRKFVFSLDSMHCGRIRIRAILESRFLNDLLSLRDEKSSNDSSGNNWFSMPSALSVYNSYLNLDKNRNGMLSKEELANYGSGTLTSVFIDRVFEECQTYNGEMDYKSYLDFVLALENRQTPAALHYIFRLLDVQHRGYLTTQTLYFFFKGIQEQLKNAKAETINFEDINNEIFDLVKPADPCKIKLKDLINCGKGETIVSILVEFQKFWAYENRDENPQYI